MQTQVKERGEKFTGEEVRAILGGRKSMFRRVDKKLNDFLGPTFPDNPLDKLTFDGSVAVVEVQTSVDDTSEFRFKFPYEPGMRLWVKEKWKPCWVALPGISGPGISYAADGKALGRVEAGQIQEAHYSRDAKWRPSIHMPRWASRITLEVTDVRCERLQSITMEDCVAEGMSKDWEGQFECGHPDCDAKNNMHYGEQWHFLRTWDSINASRGYSWESNPLVWAVSFKRLEKSNV